MNILQSATINCVVAATKDSEQLRSQHDSFNLNKQETDDSVKGQLRKGCIKRSNMADIHYGLWRILCIWIGRLRISRPHFITFQKTAVLVRWRGTETCDKLRLKQGCRTRVPQESICDPRSPEYFRVTQFNKYNIIRSTEYKMTISFPQNMFRNCKSSV